MIPGSNARDSTLGQGMLWLAAIGLLLGFTWLFQGFIPGTGKMLTGEDEQGRAMVILQQDRSGHYFAEGLVNGRPVQFLVDTGATDVAISEAAARSLGIELGPRVRCRPPPGRRPPGWRALTVWPLAACGWKMCAPPSPRAWASRPCWA